jgi:MFS family permease
MVESDESRNDLNRLYTRSVVNSFGSGLVSPFMGDYANRLGASSTEMGWFQSASNLSNNVMQVFWGRLSDRFGRRIPFIVVGGLVVAGLWIPIMFVTHASQLIVLLVIQALLGSMATPVWTALIGDLVPSFKLGRINADISLWATVGSLVATLASGVITLNVGGTVQEMFFIPFIVATFSGLAASSIMLSVKEKSTPKTGSKAGFTSEILDVWKHAKETPDFIKYCYVAGFSEFFMSFAWPLLPITRMTILNGAMFHVALMTVVGSIVTIIFQRWAGRLADRTGRKPLLVFYRLGLVSVPIAYAFSPNIETLIVINAFWGVITALGQVGLTAYLLDVSPQDYRGSFIALFNLTIGVVTFFGSLIGGYLSDYMTGLFGSLVIGLQIVYIISTLGRVIGVALHMRLPETLKVKN